MATSSSVGRLGLLPAELQLQIYRYLLVDDNDLNIRLPFDNEEPRKYRKGHVDRSIPCRHVEIMRTCRLAYSEVLAVLYGENILKASSDVDIDKFLHYIGPLACGYIRNLVIERSYQGTYEQHLAWLGPHQLPNLRTMKLDITVEPDAQYPRVEFDVEVCRSFVHNVLVRGCYVSERLPACVWTVSCRVRNHRVNFSFRSDPVGKHVLGAPKAVDIMVKDRSVRFKYSYPPHTMVYESAWRLAGVIDLDDKESASAVCQMIE